MTIPAGPEGPAGTVFAPSAGRGPTVTLLSGHSGPPLYQGYAAEIARLGYQAVLLDGKDGGASNLRLAIARAERSPHGVPGKVAVVGFSLGGGAALMHAARMPDLVSAVVAYYPLTRGIADMRAFASGFRVPILVLAGERDRYRDCCLIESMRAMDAAARDGGAPFELVVYPHAEHGFNLATSAYRAGDDADAWLRTIAFLRRYHPLPAR